LEKNYAEESHNSSRVAIWFKKTGCNCNVKRGRSKLPNYQKKLELLKERKGEGTRKKNSR